MSKENAPNPEANLGKSFEKFMRKNTLPNPIDWDDNPLQRGAIWKGDQVYTINGKQFVTDSIVLTVKGDILELEKGEQPYSFEALLLKNGELLANLEYRSDTESTHFMDLADETTMELGFVAVDIDTLDYFMHKFDEGTGDDALEFKAIDFNGEHNTW